MSHNLNLIQIAHMFKPVRTFNTKLSNELQESDKLRHTFYGDLLVQHEGSGGPNEWIVSSILEERIIDGSDKKEYRVRWYGYDEGMDTWEGSYARLRTRATRSVASAKCQQCRNLCGQACHAQWKFRHL